MTLAGGMAGLSIPQKGNFMGLSIELSVANLYRTYPPPDASRLAVWLISALRFLVGRNSSRTPINCDPLRITSIQFSSCC